MGETTSGACTVIIGAGLAGCRTATALREFGYSGEIHLIGDEVEEPYDRPPLSKQVLAGTRHPDDSLLHESTHWDALDIKLIRGRAATAVGRDFVELDDGSVHEFTSAVIATGASARQLPGQPADPRVHTLRTRADALGLRNALTSSRSLAVIGGGFIGGEVAAVARGMGLSVTMVEATQAPLSRALGMQAALACAELHVRNGVDLVVGRSIEEIVSAAGGVRAVLDNSDELLVDQVLVGVGSAPNVGWLSGSDLPISDGIECDLVGRVSGRPNVFAVGDVAAWQIRQCGRRRYEHWTSAGDQARIVAQVITDSVVQELPPPYFWSDQYRTKLQLVGWPDLADQEEFAVAPSDGKLRAVLYYRDASLVAALTFSAPRLLAGLRLAVAQSVQRAGLASVLDGLEIISPAAMSPVLVSP